MPRLRHDHEFRPFHTRPVSSGDACEPGRCAPGNRLGTDDSVVDLQRMAQPNDVGHRSDTDVAVGPIGDHGNRNSRVGNSVLGISRGDYLNDDTASGMHKPDPQLPTVKMQQQLIKRQGMSVPLGSVGSLRVGILSAILVACFLFSGCQIVIGVLQMVQGKPQVPAHFTAKTGKSLTDKNAKVLVLAAADSAALSNHPSLATEVVQQVSSKLRVHDIKTVDSAEVVRFLDTGEVIDEKSDFLEIGKQFKADYVILIKFDSFATRQENSVGLYRGTARANIMVWSITGKGNNSKAQRIYNKVHESKYPVHQPIESDSEHSELFQSKFMDLLSKELARHFYDHPPGDEI